MQCQQSVPSIVEECREDDGHEDEDEEEEEEEIICDTKNKRMQSIVDLVMWRDASRSAFVFGIGSFLVISSSYTKDFNFSLISTFSYLCLLYLATIFLYTSIARCDGNNVEDRSAVLTEEDATQLISNLLPYINDILTKTKILFSGDPATTIKAAMPLFLLARYGGIVPISTMFKLAFFGAFTVPRFLSAYSLQIERYATFLLNRARDAWDTCTHKKAAAATTFVVLWNLFSPSARAWIVFMLLVLLRYSHQITGTSGLTIDIGITDDTMKNNSEMDPPVSQISECTDVLQ
ncbi:hypothetical protein ZOSMA_294G00160 [Zostera marina]|uniref:Reticulon-like protein n=1 Tax=Zostera marina TaxID=29655 RepID=A0A0K9PC60_ZOSMR|nr:hypothetical protein ZOSMA_294G00160 [Zostera marina]